MAMLKGSHPDIIDQNIKHLKDNGYTHANATRVAMRHAKKGSAKKDQAIAQKVVNFDTKKFRA